jgi:hypothetical protein
MISTIYLPGFVNELEDTWKQFSTVISEKIDALKQAANAEEENKMKIEEKAIQEENYQSAIDNYICPYCHGKLKTDNSINRLCEKCEMTFVLDSTVESKYVSQIDGV